MGEGSRGRRDDRRGRSRWLEHIVLAALALAGLGWPPEAGEPEPSVARSSPAVVAEARRGDMSRVALEARRPVRRAERTRAAPARRAGRPAPRRGRYHPTGKLRGVAGASRVHGSGTLHTFHVSVERGLGIDAEAFARRVELILFHRRGWTRGGEVAFQRVASGPATFHVSLASPSLTDRLCAPAATRGAFSCHNAGMVVINFRRWMHGSRSYGSDVARYRTYVVNHEVGHALGHGHVGCPGKGVPAPVMMQQTIGVGACEPNPWPRPYERG